MSDPKAPDSRHGDSAGAGALARTTGGAIAPAGTTSVGTGWQNPSAPPVVVDRPPTYEELTRRVRHLEALCADVFTAAVEWGMPQEILSRLWVIAGGGEPPQATSFDYAQALAFATKLGPVPRTPEAPPLPPIKTRQAVLVVDDDPMMLGILTRILSRENYQVTTATSGEAGLAAARRLPALDLLVTDVAMPDLMGPDLAKAVRALFPDVAVLFQTGFSDVLFEIQPEMGSRMTFLEKPFTSRGLIEAARRALFGTIAPK